jgi:serine/threonine protein kinase/tetratricopeptide (TPR) repeat protein
MTGQTIHHYKIGERLGAGGMGEVYLAEDTRLGRQVALKILPASFQYDLDRRERFLKEARAASSLSSPNITAIFDIGEYDGSSYIVMEYVEGDVLSKKIERGPLPINEAIDALMQVSDALDEAHRLGIVHRDIKSANIIITERGLAKVLDFGLAKFDAKGATGDSLQTIDLSDSHPTLMLGNETSAGLVLGTVAYMSPEQALGREVDQRSDIFSLGIVAYEMLTAQMPFLGNSVTEIIDSILHREPAAISRFNYNVPPELERIVRKALEKDAAFRYQSARDLFIDLHTLRRDLEGDNRTTALNSGSTELSRTSALLDTIRPTGEIEPPPKLENAVAIMNFSNITKEPSDDWIGAGLAETVTADLKNVKGLQVIGRERVFGTLKNLNHGSLPDFDEEFAIDVGKRLGAKWIIGGGFQRIGEMIRITVRAVEVESGALIKTGKIDGKISQIFDLQDKIVYELTEGLNVQLDTSELTEIEHDETQSVEAYENFSRGMVNLRTGSRDTLDRAIYYFERAIEHDPNYARAWAALGAVHDLKGSFLSIPELSHKAIELEKKAIELSPKLSHAYQWLGGAYNSLGRFDEAIEAITEAVRLEPNNAGAHASLARAYWIGKGMIDKGIEELQHALTLNPDQGYAYLQLAFLYTIRGDYRRAKLAARQAIELQEKFISGKEGLQVVGAHSRLGYVFYKQGLYSEAINEYEKEREFLSSSDHALRERSLIELDQKTGAAYLRKGDPESAEKYFKRALKKFDERLVKGTDDPFTKYYIACLYALKGDADQAINMLSETFIQLRALNTVRAKTDPDFDGIRDDPRFHELIGATE